MNSQDLTINKLFSQAVSSFGERIALQVKRDNLWSSVNYRDLEAQGLSIAAFLNAQGFKKGDFVALLLENRPEWAMIYLGIMFAGLSCVPLDPQLNAREVENLITDCGARCLFTCRSIFLEKNISGLKHKFSRIILLDSAAEEEGLVDFSKVRLTPYQGIALSQVYPQDTASLIYTSGTTGKPKGVLLSHYNLCSNFMSIREMNIVFETDNFLSILPLYHTYPFMVNLLAPLLSGARITYAQSLKPEELTGIIRDAGVTILVGVPQLFSMICGKIMEKLKVIPAFLRPLAVPVVKSRVRGSFGRSLRLLVSGGARLEPRVARLLSGLGLKIIEGYGLTETSPVVTFNPAERVKFGSVGKPVPGVEIKISAPDKSGLGEVLIKGPNVMQGYFKQPELTGDTVRDGWFYSGDLGYVDSEGYLFLSGRKKDVIVLGSGKNIYPEEMEEYYGRSAYIREICVLSRKEEKFGRIQELLHAVIVPNLDYFRLKNEKNIRAKLRWELENLARALPSYKHIMGFTAVKEELPRTRLKKIKRYEVEQKYLRKKPLPEEAEKALLSAEDLKLLNTGTAKKVIEYLYKELKKPVYLDSHLEIDLGIDSLSRVELGLGLESYLSLKIPDNFVDRVSTVKEVITGMLELAGTQKGTAYAREAGEKEKAWSRILKEPPSKETIGKVSVSLTALDDTVAFIFKNVFLFMFRLFWLLRVEGRERIPAQGPYIFCSNHASYLDGFFIFASLPFKCARNVFFIGHAAIFEHPLVRWAERLARLIPIDPGTHLTEAMQATAFVLGHKKFACIFPEGGRSSGPEMGEFRKGIGILAKELNIGIIPVRIKGSYYSWPRGSVLPRPYPIRVVFGRPFNAGELKTAGLELGAKDDYEAITLGIRQAIAKLGEP